VPPTLVGRQFPEAGLVHAGPALGRNGGNLDTLQDTFTYRGMTIPTDMLVSLNLYVSARQPPGGFLTAVLCNNLKAAVLSADPMNLKVLPAFVAYCYNEIPSICWGSSKKVDDWIAGLDNEGEI
jgi:hypothetical protein